jgi:hypothetical protein
VRRLLRVSGWVGLIRRMGEGLLRRHRRMRRKRETISAFRRGSRRDVGLRRGRVEKVRGRREAAHVG